MIRNFDNSLTKYRISFTALLFPTNIRNIKNLVLNLSSPPSDTPLPLNEQFIFKTIEKKKKRSNRRVPRLNDGFYSIDDTLLPPPILLRSIQDGARTINRDPYLETRGLPVSWITRGPLAKQIASFEMNDVYLESSRGDLSKLSPHNVAITKHVVSRRGGREFTTRREFVAIQLRN